MRSGIERAVRIVDHDCEDGPRLVRIGTTRSGTEIRVNAAFFRAAVREMGQNALLAAVGRSRAEGREPSAAFLREGPYGIPVPAAR